MLLAGFGSSPRQAVCFCVLRARYVRRGALRVPVGAPPADPTERAVRSELPNLQAVLKSKRQEPTRERERDNLHSMFLLGISVFERRALRRVATAVERVAAPMASKPPCPQAPLGNMSARAARPTGFVDSSGLAASWPQPRSNREDSPRQTPSRNCGDDLGQQYLEIHEAITWPYSASTNIEIVPQSRRLPGSRHADKNLSNRCRIGVELSPRETNYC